MILNITFSVDKEVAEDWITWMKDKHIPDLLIKGIFSEAKILKVLSHEDDHTFSYAVQYFLGSMKNIEEYLNADDIQKRYGERGPFLSHPARRDLGSFATAMFANPVFVKSYRSKTKTHESLP